jgi:hypothetical protein
MKDVSSTRRGGLPVTLLAAASTLAWLWDVSLSATLPEAGLWAIPHILAVLGALLWTVALVSRSSSRPWSRFLAVLGFVLVVGVWGVGFLWSDGGGSNLGYLTPGNLILTILVGYLAIWTFLRSLKARPGPESSSALPPLLHGALALVWAGTVVVDYAGWPNLWRGPEFLVLVGCVFGLPLALVARAHPLRWSATVMAAFYCGLVVLAGGVLYALPVTWFTGAPGPEHFRILPLPLLLFLPGLAIDWVEVRSWLPKNLIGDSLRAGIMGGVFLLVTWVAHRYVAEPFLAPGGFGRKVADLWLPASGLEEDWRLRYWTLLPGRRRWAVGMASALAAAVLSLRVGLWLGERIRAVKNNSD